MVNAGAEDVMQLNPDPLLNMEDSAGLSAGSACVPQVVFQSSALPAGERFDAWRESVLPLFDSIPEEPPETFRARVEGIDLGSVFFGMSAFSRLRFRRGAQHPGSGDADHLLVQLYLTGGYAGHNGYREVHVRPGDISLLDLGRELQTRAHASNVLSLVIPREQIYAYADPGRIAYGSVLRADSAMGRMLGNHLLTAWREMRIALPEDMANIRHLLLCSVVGAFSDLAAGERRRRERITLEAIRAYLAQHLMEQLEPEALCRRFSCSRAQLYRLFQPFGGVAAYIRGARLQRCWEELTEGRNGRKQRVFDVALRWGFTNQSHFNRLFRQAFGVTPGQAVELGAAQWRTRRMAVRHSRCALPELHDILRRI